MLFKHFNLLLLLACFAVNAFGHPASVPYLFDKAAYASVFEGKYIRTELYFGLSRKGKPDVAETEFQTFIDVIVTPRFPDGLTIVEGRGQWRESDQTIAKERSKVLILIYPKRDKRLASRKIDEIREEYKKRFAQSSVLRVDMSKSLVVTF